ncbi:MAG TPA: AAA family ATPase [Lacipirellulaceae bacterium]|nr:AAA family ATPase [Lacipirellulaceae bacterium]
MPAVAAHPTTASNLPIPMPATAQTLRQLAERDERAFPSYPQVARYFPASTMEDARTRLGRAIERGNGPGIVIGGPGTGKSLLLQVLAAQYHEEFDIVLPACARLCTRRALLQSILFELGLPYRSRDEGELRLSLLDHLLSKDECPSGLLLLIDEAQTLPISLLDELRVLTNVVRGGLPRVRLILAGSSALEETFADPELESFAQRLAARCYLGPFNSEETSQFIRAQLAASRARADELFAQDAWTAVFEATDGVPRLVNQLCDRALMEAGAAGRARIDRQVIQSAWADMQQIPTPWDTPESATSESASPVVEFGNLIVNSPCNQSADRLANEGANGYDKGALSRFAESDTELDVDDDASATAMISMTAASDIEKTWQRGAPPQRITDPFAERFDEEEVVLDNFATWDEMFRYTTQRVANRRDPEFANLVATAIEKAPANGPRQKGQRLDSSFEFDLQNVGIIDQDVKAEEAPSEVEPAWATLRIADVSDIPTNPVLDESLVHDPVLIVEDDATVPGPPKPPVRREEYRQLFSRLRSG